MNFLFRTIQFGFMHIWPALVLFFSAATLPKEALGTVAIIMSVATLFRPLVGFSLGRTALRFAGEAHAKYGEEGANAAVGLALRLGVALSVVSLAVAFPTLLVVDRVYGFESTQITLILSAAFLYFFGITEFLDGLMRASGHFRALAVSVLISRIVGIGLFAFFLPFVPSVQALLFFLAIAEMTAVLLLLRHIIPMFRREDFGRLGIFSGEAGKLLSYAVPVIINAVSVYLYARVMVMIVGLYSPSADVGAFEMAVQVTNLPMAITIICATVLSPSIGRLVHQGNEGLALASQVASYGGAFTVWVNMMAAVYLTAVGPFVLAVWFPHLTILGPVLVIIAPLVAIKAFAQFVSGEISIATGTAGLAAKITIVFAFVTVAMGVVLCWRYGAIGGAVAMLLAHTGAVLATIVFLQPKTGLILNFRIWDNFLAALLVGIPTVATVLTWWESPAVAAIGGTAVFAVSAIALVCIGGYFGIGAVEPVKDGLRMLRSRGVSVRRVGSEVAGMFPNAHKDPQEFSKAILHHCRSMSPATHDFWLSGSGNAKDIGWQDHADYIYVLKLLGLTGKVSLQSVREYFTLIADSPMYGRPLDQGNAQVAPNAHLTAYILGSAWLLEQATGERLPESTWQGWQVDRIVDPATLLPRFPKAWAHHIWRVSHWIGGGPSILFNLARWGTVPGVDLALVDKVLTATEKGLMDPKTDLLRPYSSRLIQRLFRLLYKLNHDPDVADIGGVVHILWVHYALGRPYRNAPELLLRSQEHMLENTPFLESVPYCLDFDIVQLVRTAQPAETDHPANVVRRAERFLADTGDFLTKVPAEGYSLHKVPGALATMHEAALIARRDQVDYLGVPPIDIIRLAGWL